METSEDNPHHSATSQWLLGLMFFSGVCDLLLLKFVVPVFGAMFADFGATLPRPTQFFLDASNFLSANHYLGFALLSVGLIGGTIGAMISLSESDGSNGVVQLCLMVLFTAFLLLTVGMVWAVFLPVTYHGGVVS